jgi:hypothetical protein
MKRLILSAAAPAVLALSLSACAVRPPAMTAIPLIEVEPDWKQMLSAPDRGWLEAMPSAWAAARAAVPARMARFAAREGVLLDPQAARFHPLPTPGSYRCRLVRLSGGKGPGQGMIRSFPENFCYIGGTEADELSFTKQTGTELPGGWLHADSPRRMVLTGAMQARPGDNSLAYGTQSARNVVGVLERIGPLRWRLVLPLRDGQAGLDVYDLTPVGQDQQVVEPALK